MKIWFCSVCCVYQAKHILDKFCTAIESKRASQVMALVKNPLAKAGDIRDAGSIPGSRRAPGGGHGNPLQYSCLENPMHRGDRQAIVHGVAKSWT